MGSVDFFKSHRTFCRSRGVLAWSFLAGRTELACLARLLSSVENFAWISAVASQTVTLHRRREAGGS
jgi:hypothetical protein